MPVYKPNVPQSTDYISQSQRDFLGNFESVNQIYGYGTAFDNNIGDHVPLTVEGEDVQGAHKKTTLVVQGSDPSPSANEAVMYTKTTGGQPELYYRRNGDAAGYQLTSNGRLSPGGLVLRAYVMFDLAGKIIEIERVDSDGNKIIVPVRFNIASVTPNAPLPDGSNIRSDYTVAFTNSIGTADYIWVVNSFNSGRVISGTGRRTNMQVKNGATYGDSVTATSIKLAGYWVSSTGTVTPPTSFFQTLRVQLQVYTVTS